MFFKNSSIQEKQFYSNKNDNIHKQRSTVGFNEKYKVYRKKITNPFNNYNTTTLISFVAFCIMTLLLIVLEKLTCLVCSMTYKIFIEQMLINKTNLHKKVSDLYCTQQPRKPCFFLHFCLLQPDGQNIHRIGAHQFKTNLHQ